MHRRTLSLLAAALLLVAAACSSGDDTSTGSPSSSPSGTASSSGVASGQPAPTESVVEITASVRDGKVRPKPHRVDVPLGSQIRLQVTSDVDDELHVHGFDVEVELEAGRTAVVELSADQQGVFEVETHETELELLQLEVR